MPGAEICRLTEHWRDPNERLKSFEADLRKAGVYVPARRRLRSMDLEVRAGLLGFRALAHGGGGSRCR